MRWFIRHCLPSFVSVLLIAAAVAHAQPSHVRPLPLAWSAESFDDTTGDVEEAAFTFPPGPATTYRLSSSVDEWWDTVSHSWIPANRTVNRYDAEGRQTDMSFQLWNLPGWLTNWHREYTYDGEGRLLEIFDDERQGSSLVRTTRERRSYDGEGRVVGFFTDVWQESLWVHASWDDRSYAAAGTSDTTVSHLWSDAGWLTRDRNIRSQDDAGRLVVRVRQRRNGDAFVDASMSVYVYDEHGNRTRTESSTSDGTAWTLRKVSRDSLVYDPDGRILERFRGIGLDTPWTPQTRWSYSYDSSGARVYTLVRHRTLMSDVDPPVFAWITSAEEYRTFDAAGNLTGVVTRTWQDSVWVYSRRQTNEWEVFLLAVSEEPGVADGFRLDGNYPNPFNPSTTISYTLPAALPVRLSVYDLLGRAVATLVDGRQDAGAHRERWSADGAASGVYVYRLTTGSHTVSGKMLLLR